MKKLLVIILIVYTSNLFSQSILILDSCIEITIKNYPIFKEKAFHKKISDLNIQNNRSNYLPSIDFEGTASYQSDVFRLDIDLPDIPDFDFTFPEPPLDHYNLSINISQLLYDGGTIKNLNFIEQKKLLAEQKMIDVELYKLKEQVEKTYFSILILQKTEEQLILTIEELQKKKKTIQSAVKNGILTQDNLDILQAEIYKLEQNLIEIVETEKSGINILGELMSTELSDNPKFKLPDDFKLQNDSTKTNRPETELFTLQKDILSSNEKLLQSNRLPKLGAFAQGGYGNPGLTMINNEWNPYFIVGAKLTWKIWDKNNTKRNKEILKINSDFIDTKKEVFDKSINILCEKELGEISKLDKLIKKDNEIIHLQNRIYKKASSKLNNGIITSTDYVSLLNDKNRSIIKSEIHKIQLIQAKRNYIRIKGN